MNYVVPPAAMLRDAIRAIELGRIGIAVVLGEDGVLQGTLTDGDIRRAILAGHAIDEPVKLAMRRAAFTVSPEVPGPELLKMLEERGLEAAPVIGHDGKFRHVVHVRDLQGTSVDAGGAERFYGVVVMAGGEGKRLRPVTQNMPKPMVDVGGMPVLERLVRSFVRAGIPRIFLATNYLSHVIENHFGERSEEHTSELQSH